MTSQAPARSRWPRLWTPLALVALFAAGWFIYRPALGGTFLLDDHANLAGLRTVTDLPSALNFVLTGSSGPLGRPIALASFLPQASAWGHDAVPFLQGNILIHLLNGFLVFLFSRQLAMAASSNRADARLVAFGTTAIWLFMPLLATSSLLIVQRMTTLSATFVLFGLYAYLVARERLTERPRVALGAMTVALVSGTVLAVFTKENGVLLPTFVLVIELTLLGPPRSLSASSWNTWRGVFLAAPTIVTAAFLFSQVPYSEAIVDQRGFSATGRLLSEARILWEYLFGAFFASGANLGPFHESREVSSFLSEPLAITAVAAWIVMIVAAVRYRNSYPVATFAVFWFLAGHLLESTTIPLELYFEHRNYLPVIGPVFAACHFVLRVPGRYRVISRLALAAYAVINAGILFGITSMWGNPLQAAAYWHKQNPASVRAATTLASQQLSKVGPETAIETLSSFATATPRYGYIRIPELNLACMTAPRQDHTDLVRYLEANLPSVAYSMTTGEMLDQLLTTSFNSQCDSVRPATIANLAAAVMENPRYKGSTRYVQFHHMLMARIARSSGDTTATLDHLARAVAVAPSADLNMMTVSTLVEAGRFDHARAFIEDARTRLSRHPFRRYSSKRNLDELLLYVSEAEKLHEDRVGPDKGG